MAIERPSSIANVARFLGASEDEVVRFLEEGRLGGALIAALNQKGLQITPGVKNSVERVVRTIDPETGATPSATPRSQVLTSEATATIMFTDVVGSSAMTERLGTAPPEISSGPTTKSSAGRRGSTEGWRSSRWAMASC